VTARVVLFGCYADGEGYPRPRLVREALERAGAEVVACCRVDPIGARWPRHRSPVRSAVAIARALPAVARAYRKAPPHDLVYVGPGGFLEAAYLGGRILARARGRRPAVLFDPLYSLHDTIVGDRELVGKTSFRARAVRWLEARALGAADRVLVDTDATGDFFSDEYRLPRDRFRRLRVGSIFDAASPPRRERRGPGAPLDVLYVGSYIPLHGLDVVMAAAQRLRDSGVRFTLVGSGQEERRIAALVKSRERELRHVRLEGGFVGGRELLELYARSDAALGIFGTSPKALRVVPFKVNDAMALSLPLVTADTRAAREVLVDGESALLVKPGSPDLLAAALLRLRDDPALRERLGRGARAAFDASASAEASAFEMRVALEGLVPRADEEERDGRTPVETPA